MIIDSHAHVGMTVFGPCLDKSAEGLLSLMDHLGIDVSISANHHLVAGLLEKGFGTGVETYRLSEGRILNYAFFNPHYPKAYLPWARRCLEHHSFVGIKIHPRRAECFAEDDRWDPVWQLASEFSVPILAHTWWVSDYNPGQRYATPDRFERFVQAYPDVNLILGHAGWRDDGNRAAAALMQAYDNVYVDFAGDIYWFKVVEWFVSQVGHDRILFGSDATLIDTRTALGRILDADISTEAKAAILGGNAADLFGLSPR